MRWVEYYERKFKRPPKQEEVKDNPYDTLGKSQKTIGNVDRTISTSTSGAGS